MPKSPRSKAYIAIRQGKNGPCICDNWSDALAQLEGVPALFRTFEERSHAEAYLSASSPDALRFAPYPTTHASSGQPSSSGTLKPPSQSQFAFGSLSSRKSKTAPKRKPDIIVLSSDSIAEDASPIKVVKTLSKRPPAKRRTKGSPRSPDPMASSEKTPVLSSFGSPASKPLHAFHFPDDGGIDPEEEEAMKSLHYQDEDVPEEVMKELYEDYKAARELEIPIPSTSNALLPLVAQPVVLSPDQDAILRLALSGANVFFTGSAGTGKSVLMREIIRQLKQRFTRSGTVYVTASTGMAASNLGTGATTLHSFAGLGLAKELKEDLFKKLLGKSHKYPRDRWKAAQVLIMQDPRPFGGIQIIATGDFFQLPPVPDYHNSFAKKSCFAFKANSWPNVFKHVHMLKNVFRQHDPKFITVLNEMRMGTCSNESLAIMRSLDREVHYDDGIQPTSLMARRFQVDDQNALRLQTLQGAVRVFDAHDTLGEAGSKKGLSRHDMINKLNKNVLIPDRLELKIGAQVMLCRNLKDCALVNGSVGIVVAYQSAADLVEGAANDPEAVMVAQMEDQPSKKKQSRQYDQVAKTNPAREDVPAGEWPVVEFRSVITGRQTRLLIPPTDFALEDAEGKVECSRFGVPLILAWCLTVHKAQGQTIERLKVDLSHVFEKGQAYVAISRGVKLDHIEVRRFSAAAVKAHPDVIEWSKTLR